MRALIACFVFICLSSLYDCATRDRNNNKYKVVCYWGAWSYYRQGNGKFQAEDSNPNLCTHMIYGFAILNEATGGVDLYDKELDTGDTDWNSGLQWGHGMFRRFNLLRSYNTHLTTLISIGGWNEGSDKYAKMASTDAGRKKFAQSVLAFLEKYDFDGFDVDWEYPGQKAVKDATRVPGSDEDKANYVALLKELHNALNPKGYVLSIAVSAGKPTIDKGFDVKQVSANVDFINLMTYDFHGGWDNHTAHNAPLHAHPTDNELDKEFTVEYAVNYWLSLGADPKKLIMGIPLYARTFTLKSATEYGVGAPVTGAGGTAGQFTVLVGYLAYYEVCTNKGMKVYRDEVGKVPYGVSGLNWIGFDDVQSVKDKVEFIKSKGIGGGMVWDISTDDFRNLCGGGKNPLLKTISGGLNGITGPEPVIPETHATSPGTGTPTTPQVTTPPTATPTARSTVSPTARSTASPTARSTASPTARSTASPTARSTASPTGSPITAKSTAKPTATPITKSTPRTTEKRKTTTTEIPITEEPSTPEPITIREEFVCKATGFFPDPNDKTIFHECVDVGNNKLKDFLFHCGEGTVYDTVNHVCKMPNLS